MLAGLNAVGDRGAILMTAGASRAETRGCGCGRALQAEVLERSVQFSTDLVERFFSGDQVVCEDPLSELYYVRRIEIIANEHACTRSITVAGPIVITSSLRVVLRKVSSSF